MLRILSPLKPKNLLPKQVPAVLFSSLFNTGPHNNPPPSTSSRTESTQLDISSLDFKPVKEAVISECFRLWGGESSNLYGLKDLLLDVSRVVPGVSRRLRRVSALGPEDVVELLVGFRNECGREGVQRGKVESLWGIFRWANNQDRSFRHCEDSCEVMASMLLRHGMLREVQLLLFDVEKRGIVFDSGRVLCGLIEGYVGAGDVERAVLAYDQMRERGLVPSLSCHCGLIGLLVKMERTKLAHRVCVDMIELGTKLEHALKGVLEDVTRLLCRAQMIREARKLVSKIMASGLEPCNSVLNEIACGYCENKDFEELLGFLVDSKCSLTVLSGNKIICSLCRNSGVEKADLFMMKLEHIGFRPNKMTFGILVSRCCKEGDLRSALIYFSEMFSRGLKPDIWSYNALIGGVLKKGLYKHARVILDEVIEKGVAPNSTTFRVLIAGYCKARRFDEAKSMVLEMVKHGLVESSALQDPLSMAFTVLGLDPLSVKLKRDNSVGLWKMECQDSLGNGLYLDTDVDEFDKVMASILDNSFAPDYDLLIKKECGRGNVEAAFLLADEMLRWGLELSPTVFSALIWAHPASYHHVKQCSDLIEKMPNLSKHLDEKVLNLLTRFYCKTGLTWKARILFDQIIQRKLAVATGTYTALILGFCRKGSMQDTHEFWDVARNAKWLPKLRDFKSLVECFCQHGMLKEAVELFESMLTSDPRSWREICQLFIEKLSSTGFMGIALVLEKQLLQLGFVLNDVSYSHLIRGFCREHNHTAAFALLETLLSKGSVLRLDDCLSLIPPLCKAGKYETAKALKDIDLAEQSRSSVYGELIKGLCIAGREEVASLCREMFSKGLSPDGETYNILFCRYCKDKSSGKVRELLGAMTRRHISLSASSYRNCLQLMCGEGRFIHALRVKNLMVGECKSHNLIIYNILIFKLLSVRNKLVVNEILLEMREKGLGADEVTYNFLIRGFSSCGDASRCLTYIYTMTSLGFRPDHRSLRAVINILHRCGEFDKVMELSRLIEAQSWVPASYVQNAIVEGLLSVNKLREAEDFLDRIANKGLIPDTVNYDYLIKQFCHRGRLKKAVELVDIMVKKGNNPDVTSFDCIIQSLCAWNLTNLAMEFHTEMLDRHMKPSVATWDTLVQKLCQHGLTADAEELLVSMSWFGKTPTRQMFAAVIDRYRYENNLRKVSELMQMMQQCGYEPDFDTHWSLISRLSSNKDHKDQGFLSRLLFGKCYSLRFANERAG